MKKLLYLFVLAGVTMLLFTASVALAAEAPKTGVVDLSAVITQSDAGKKANEELNALVQSKKDAAGELAKNFVQMKKDFEQAAPNLSEADRVTRQAELEKTAKNYRDTVAESNAEIQKATQRIRNQVLTDIRGVIAELAKAEHFTIILDADTVPFYEKNSEAELTAKVLARYNQAKASGK